MEKAREARQQHQAQPDHAVNHHKRHLREPILFDQPRCGDQEREQQAVPKNMPPVLEDANVLVVIGFENEPHGSDLFPQFFTEQTVRF
jgi:hypothetical protein